MQYVSALTTVESVIRQLDKADPGTLPTAAQAEYNDFFTLLQNDIIPMVSAYITDTTHQQFVPYYQARTLYANDLLYHGRLVTGAFRTRVILDAPLLVTSSVSWRGDTIDPSLYREVDNTTPPFYALDFSPSVSLLSTDFDDALIVTGTWGFHNNTAQMYRTVDASVTINSSSSNLSVADASRYETLQYIKVESELMQITSRNETTDILTVRRGVNGTTATAHTSVSVSVYAPIDDIRQAATRLASWSYQHRNDLGDRLQFADGTVVITAMPAFVREVINSKTAFKMPTRI